MSIPDSAMTSRPWPASTASAGCDTAAHGLDFRSPPKNRVNAWAIWLRQALCTGGEQHFPADPHERIEDRCRRIFDILPDRGVLFHIPPVFDLVIGQTIPRIPRRSHRRNTFAVSSTPSKRFLPRVAPTAKQQPLAHGAFRIFEMQPVFSGPEGLAPVDKRLELGSGIVEKNRRWPPPRHRPCEAADKCHASYRHRSGSNPSFRRRSVPCTVRCVGGTPRRYAFQHPVFPPPP